MKKYTHGGDLVSARSCYKGEILDFSANLNPLGMPEPVLRAAEAAVRDAVHYPDPLCRSLTAGIARRDGVDPAWVLCGNGAADIIFRMAFSQPPARALVTAPTFSEYAGALEAAGWKIVRHWLSAETDFDLTDSVIETLDGVELAVFCTPNNPTGRPIHRTLLLNILAHCRKKGIRLVVDECFLELSDGGENGGLAGYLEEYPNLLLLRAFTKSFAIPGLRLGYCLTSDLELLERLSRCAQPWSVSAPAQAAGVAALECPDHPARARAHIASERPWLTEQLETLGLRTFPSTANYILFRADGIEDLKSRLLKRGILIRSCADYEGLSSDYYRVAVKLRPDNLRLIQAMKEVI